MKLFYVIVFVSVILLILFLYSILKISSKYSRDEERLEYEMVKKTLD